jgi:RNA polymerase sigma-70 factor (ECF subfamily)
VTTWDEQEFEALFRRVYPRLLRASELFLAERPAAEDCAQEAFARLLAQGAMPAAGAERWVFRVGRNLAVDRLRHLRRIVPLSEGAESPFRPAAPGAAGRRAALRTAVSELSSRQREVVALRIYGELSYEEIATAVGRSLGSVKQELHRAKLALKARLNGMDLEDVDG